MLTAILLAGLAIAGRPDTARVVVVATTDVHGHVLAWDDVADRPAPEGLVRAARVVDSLRRAYPGQVVVVDAGDLIQGSPFAAWAAAREPAPHPVVDALDGIRYDAATPGNHEFDFGLPFMRRALAGAAFPYVSANIEVLPAGRPMFRPSVVLRKGAVRVGITGFTTPGVMVWSRDKVAGRARVRPIGRSAPAVLRALRGASDVVVALVHSGMDGTSSYDTTGVGPEDVAAALAAGPAAPDLVVVGHSHREMRDSVIGATHFVQPRPYAQQVSVTHLLLVRGTARRWRLARVASDLVPLAAVPPDARLEARLRPAHEAARAWLAEPIGHALAAMPGARGRVEPVPLVGFIQSVQRARTGARLSSTAVFRPEAGFPEGAVRRRDVLAVYPYENTLRAIRVTGAQLRAYLEQSARWYLVDPAGTVAANPGIPGYNYDVVSGADYAIDLARPPGERIRDLRVDGREVAPADTFTLALNSYRAAGGGAFTMLAGAPVVYDRGEGVRDVLLEAVERAGTLDPARYAERNWRLVPDSLARRAEGLVAGAAPVRPPAPRADSVALRVVTINDLHGALLPRAYPWSRGRLVGGVAALAAAMDSAEARCACPTLRLDAGDEMQGTLESNLTFGGATIAALGRMRLAAAALGNHEFDWGPDTLRARMAEAPYPWLAANVFDSATGARPAWLRSHVLLRAGPLRVAVVGWASLRSKTMIKGAYTAGLRFGARAADIRDVLDSVRALRPDVTILLAHEGGFCDSAGPCRGEVFDLARELDPAEVQLVVAGHTHVKLATVVHGIPVLQARWSGTALGIADFVRAPGGGWTVRLDVPTVYADEVTPDTALANRVEALRLRTDALARRVVARLAAPVAKVDTAESPLGDLLADAHRWAGRADVGLMNNGGIRGTSLAAGDLTYEDLYRLQPFGNRIVVLTLTGAELRQVLERAVASATAGDAGLHVSGLRVTWSPAAPSGARLREVRLDDGRRLDPAARYRVAMNDFLAGGGSGYAMLAPLPRAETPYTDLEAVEAWLQAQPQPVRPPEAGRWRTVP